MTLEMVTDPNEIIDHSLEYCECCANNIGVIPGEFVECRQEIDIPPITPIVTEHRVYKKKCSRYRKEQIWKKD